MICTSVLPARRDNQPPGNQWHHHRRAATTMSLRPSKSRLHQLRYESALHLHQRIYHTHQTRHHRLHPRNRRHLIAVSIYC